MPSHREVAGALVLEAVAQALFFVLPLEADACGRGKLRSSAHLQSVLDRCR